MNDDELLSAWKAGELLVIRPVSGTSRQALKQLVDSHFPHYVEPWEGPAEHALECACGASWVDYGEDIEELWAQHLADVLISGRRPCPACGSFDHDGWTDRTGCPEDWSTVQRDSFQHRRWAQLVNERVVNEVLGDHPHTDPGDGRTECQTCGKWVFEAIHSCKGVPVTEAAWARILERAAEDGGDV